MANLIQLGQGLFANYDALASKDQYQVYFTTDTHQIFVGANEYTKGTKQLTAEPTASTPGDQDRLYAYNGSLYLCTGISGGTYSWLRVANINDESGTVTAINVGEGLTTASGSTSITTTDTVQHAVPTGASTLSGDTSAIAAAFGSTFAVETTNTDKFGHVTGVNERVVTMPTETPVTAVNDTEGLSETLSYGSTFKALSGLYMDPKDNHKVHATPITFTLPDSDDTTYSISSDTEGVVTLTDSNGSASTALINGWGDLAKKSDITTVFRYKGTVATVADLQNVSNPQVGDVYQVTAGSPQGSAAEYVCTDASSTPTVWEELGTTIDLSAYATTAYVEDKLTWKTF